MQFRNVGASGFKVSEVFVSTIAFSSRRADAEKEGLSNARQQFILAYATW